jgi:Arm DNA-binding domain
VRQAGQLPFDTIGGETAMHVLSERDVKRAPEGQHPTGTKNLFLQVQGDSRSWIFRYQSRRYGCQKKIGLGSAKTITLSDARILADRQHAFIRDNTDPWDVNRKPAFVNTM